MVLETLKQRDLLPDLALVVEPTCKQKIGDTIKVGRRGSINGVLTIKGIQGHVAYPEKCSNPIELLGAKLGKIAGVYLDEGDMFFPPSKLVITDIRGGMGVTNVTPADLKLMFNVRNSTKTNVESLKTYIHESLGDLEYELHLTQSSKAFLTPQPSFLVSLLQDIIKQTCLIDTNLSTAGGTSDARHFSAFGVEVAEFGMLNDTIHSVNERVKISDLELLYDVLLQLLHRLNYEN